LVKPNPKPEGEGACQCSPYRSAYQGTKLGGEVMEGFGVDNVREVREEQILRALNAILKSLAFNMSEMGNN